jgi:hypothetical protein
VRKVVLILMAGLLSGCGFAYNINRDKLLQSATEADFGPPPPENHEEIEKAFILENLKDPESARFRSIDKINKTAIQSGFASPTPILVWITALSVNAKNSYGGYSGFQYYAFAWQNERLVAFSGPTKSMEEMVFWEYLK